MEKNDDNEKVKELLIIVSRRLDLVDAASPNPAIRPLLEACWLDLDAAIDSLPRKE